MPRGLLNIRFPGQYFDQETGLHYNRFRYYDPGIGRYVSADPIGQVGAINLYGYVLNDPVNWIDPHGLLRTSAALKKKYPKAAAHIEGIKANASKYSAFGKYGQASKADVDAALTPGSGPTCEPTSTPGVNGEFSPGVGSSTLGISEGVLASFESGDPGSKTLLESTVEHELTHYFDDQDGVDYPGEEGQKYEEAVYGSDIDTLSDGVTYERTHP